MKRIIYLVCMALACSFISSCYKDKGNYDYNDIDDIRIRFPALASPDTPKVIVRIDDTLRLSPEILHADTAHLTYSWRVHDQQKYQFINLGVQKNLTVPIRITTSTDPNAFTWAVGRFSLLLSVTDTVTKVTTSKEIILSVRSKFPIGVMVFHQVTANQCDMGVIESDDFVDVAAGQAYYETGLFSRLNNGKLADTALGIAWENSKLLLYTKHNGYEVNATTMQLILNRDFKKMGGATWTTAVEIKHVFVNRGVTVVMTNKGMRYYAGNASTLSPFTIASLNLSPSYFHSDLQVSVNYSWPIYNIGTRRFGLLDPVSYYSITYDPTNGDTFNPNSIPAGSDLVGMCYGGQNANTPTDDPANYVYAFIKHTTNKTLDAYVFNNSWFTDPTLVFASKKVSVATPGVNEDLINAVSIEMLNDISNDLGYVATQNKIYSIDLSSTAATKTIFTPPAAEKITNMRLLKGQASSSMFTTAGTLLNEVFAGRVNQTLYVSTWDGTQGRIYQIPVTTAGNLDGSRQVVKFGGFGEIKDFCFRLQ